MNSTPDARAEAKRHLESFLLIGYGYEAKISYDDKLEKWVEEIPDIELMSAIKKVVTQIGKTQDDNNYALATVLSVCMQSKFFALRNMAYDMLAQYCLSEPFLFFCLETRKLIAKRKSDLERGVWGDGFRKAITKHYKKKSDSELAKIFLTEHRHFKWTHKDLFKLSHISFPSDGKMASISYFAMGRKEKRKELSAECEALACLQDELNTSEDPSRIAYLLNELNIKLTPSSTRFNTPEVWARYVEYMQTTDILKYLEYFSKKSLRSIVLPKVLLALEKDDGTRVDPVTVFIFLHRYTSSSYQIRKRQAIEHKDEEENINEEIKKLKLDNELLMEKLPGGSKRKKGKTDKAGKEKAVKASLKPDGEVSAALGRLVARSMAALEKTQEDWLVVVSSEHGLERLVPGYRVPYSVLATALSLHLTASARSLTVTSASGEICVDPLQPETTLLNFSKVEKHKCPNGVVEWALSSGKKANRILILTDEKLTTDADIVTAMSVYRKAENLPNASLLIFGPPDVQSAIIEQGIWKFAGFHQKVLPLFCRYSKGEIKLF